MTATYPDQEFITLISKPAFWEGRVSIAGTINAEPCRGVGFVERMGFSSFSDLDGFFRQVSEVVRRSVAEVLPRQPDHNQALRLISTRDQPQHLDGVSVEQYARTLISPIRDICDRGGKAWRSYAAITCCDIVGGDSRDFVRWLALPELIHVGSLIIDDVQDRSSTRRGGPTAHRLHGEAQAINSGTAAYFLADTLLASDRLSAEEQLQIYGLFFGAMRAGHAGQALDIDGLVAAVAEIITEREDPKSLEQRVLAIHRLKTGAPAGYLARMGAIAGGGTTKQIEALGHYFEELGLAFQIIDDVLDMRGYGHDHSLMRRADDIRCGKVTLPIAKALVRMEHQERRWLHDVLAQEARDEATTQAVIGRLEELGAIEACVEHASELVERAWSVLDPVVEDSIAKVLLRAFSYYILERHY